MFHWARFAFLKKLKYSEKKIARAKPINVAELMKVSLKCLPVILSA